MAVQHREVLVGGEMDEPALLHAGGDPRRVASAEAVPDEPGRLQADGARRLA
jgi:hypothetical protein